MHRFIPIPGEVPACDARVDPSHTEAIRRWTRELLALPEDSVVTVTELACLDAGCPLVETVIAVFGEGETRSWKFTRPRVAVTRTMVLQALRPDAAG